MPAAAWGVFGADAPTFAALGDPTRLSIVTRLSEVGPLPTVRLREAGMSRQAVAKHLDVLAEVGLVESGRVGRDREWRLCPHRIEALGAYLTAVSAQWDVRLERLRRFLADEGASAS